MWLHSRDLSMGKIKRPNVSPVVKKKICNSITTLQQIGLEDGELGERWKRRQSACKREWIDQHLSGYCWLTGKWHADRCWWRTCRTFMGLLPYAGQIQCTAYWWNKFTDTHLNSHYMANTEFDCLSRACVEQPQCRTVQTSENVSLKSNLLNIKSTKSGESLTYI